MVKLLIPSREEVIQLCRQRLEDEEIKYNELNSFPYDDYIWIKFGDVGVTLAEGNTQRFVHETCDHQIMYTPEVYDYFSHRDDPSDPMVTYIVMERINGQLLAQYLKGNRGRRTQVLEAIAKAVRHVWNLPISKDGSTFLGPFGDSAQPPSDRFFSDTGAQRTFGGVAELQDWINGKLAQENQADRVDLLLEPVHLCHNDIAIHNIIIEEKHGRVVLLDWGYSGIYPRPFEEFALYSQFNLRGRRFAKELYRILFGQQPTKQMRPLTLAAAINEFGTCRYFY